MGLSSSKRVAKELRDSTDFTSACDTVYEQCLNLAQHAFPGVRPYQLVSASENLHQMLSAQHIPLIDKWVPTPPNRTQIDKSLRAVTDDDSEGITLAQAEFKEFAVELFTVAAISNAEKAVLRRVPIGVAGIVGIGLATRSGKELVGTVIGVYAVGVATSIYLSLGG